MAQAQVWAILDASGQPFCSYDSLDGFEDSNNASIPSEPQENGQLYMYDKVAQPVTVSVNLLFHGDFTQQSEALAVIEKYRASTATVTVITPSRVFVNQALVGFSTTRSSTNGVNMLEVRCQFQEVMNAFVGMNTVQWSPRNPTSADKTNRGQVQSESFLRGLF